MISLWRGIGLYHKRGLVDYNLEKEQKTEVDGTKPDAVLGFFTKETKNYRVIIELKGSKANLDAKQKSENRTPVEQAFGYVSKYENIDWVIVSNFNEIRLYSTFQGKYHSFNLKDLATHEDKKKEFVFLLSKQNLIGFNKDSKPFTKIILEESTKHVEVIQKEFYKHYKIRREDFIDNVLKNNQHLDINTAVAKVQKLFDRLLFIRFCENSSLIDNTEQLIGKIITWDTIKSLFKYIDEGELPHVSKFNGGLFANDEIFNNLIISKELLQALVTFLNKYNFKNQITINILGHIFEQSISDIEELKATLNNENHDKKQSIRKKDGIFYTPSYITEYIVQEAVGGWLEEQKIALNIYNIEEVAIPTSKIPTSKSKQEKNPNQELINKYKEYGNILENIKILDPSCGSGAFLVEVFNFLQKEWVNYHNKLYELGSVDLFDRVDNYKNILKNNIYGVDLNSESVQISKLSLWLKTAQRGHELTTLDNNIKVGNSLINDEKVETECYIDTQGNKISKAFNWQKEFPEVFKTGGFDVVVGNPPYVRQELFSQIKGYLKEKYVVYTGVADLYCYFYEHATNLLKENGKLGFITSNKWMRAKYGEPLRKFILDNVKIESFIDLTGQEVFEGVGVDANIIIYEKNKANNYQFKVSSNLKSFTPFTSNNLYVKSFNIESNEIERQIKFKIEKIGKPLKDWDIKIYRGVLTGFNDAFIIDTKTKEDLCKKDPKSLEIIKPMLRGRDISRYGYEWAGLWLINSHNGYGNTLRVNIEEDYPIIFEHLKKFEKECKNRTDQGFSWTNLRNCAYVEDFQKEKIIYPNITQDIGFTMDFSNFYINQKAYFLTSTKVNLFYLISILNSKLLRVSCKQYFPQLGKSGFEVSKFALEQLSIPQIQESDQQPFIKKAQDMLNFNKELNEISSKLLSLLKVDLGVSNITNKLGKWYNLEETEFFAEIGKQNKNLSLNEKSQWIKHFEEEKRKINDLQNKIEKTDKEIDSMVYNLYQLSEEEIKTIEYSN